jgi:hypothetical protein
MSGASLASGCTLAAFRCPQGAEFKFDWCVGYEHVVVASGEGPALGRFRDRT